MPGEQSPVSPGEALKREALRMAIEYHGQAARHPKSRGMARPTTVTATAEQFESWLREVAERAGFTPDDTES